MTDSRDARSFTIADLKARRRTVIVPPRRAKKPPRSPRSPTIDEVPPPCETSEIAAPHSAKAATVLGDDDRFGSRSPSPPTLAEARAPGRQSRDAEREQEQAAKHWLQATWPAAFPPEDQPVRPLAIGAGDIIKAAAPIELVVMVERATATWVQSIRYLTAIANGVHRVHLNGDDAGAPDEPQRKHARQRVDKMLARRNRTKTAE
jgi:hypothetical protein